MARIESGSQKPRSEKLNQIMEKMGRSGKRIESEIRVEEYEVLELKIEFAKFIHRREYEKAETVLCELENRLDSNVLENQQYIEDGKARIIYHENPETADVILNRLKELLALTLKIEPGKEFSYVLNRTEMSILTEAGLIYWMKQDYAMALKVYEFQVKQYKNSVLKPAFHILDWELAVQNYSMALEETGHVEEAVQLSKERIKQSLLAGKGTVDHSIMVLACVMEKKEKEKSIKYFRWLLCLLKLYKMDKNYEIMKQYMEEKELLIND